MKKRRARMASFSTERSRSPVSGAGARYAERVRPAERANAARRRPLVALLLVAGTLLVLGLILIFAVVHGNGTPTASPTPVASVVAGAVPLNDIGVLDPTSGSARKALAPPAVGWPAPDFSWQTLNGHTSLSALRGHTVLLEFFGVWCPACQSKVPSLNDLLATYRAKGLQVLSVNGSLYGINYERTGSEVPVGMSDLLTYQQTYHPDYPMVFDPTIRVFNLYGGGATFPTFYVIDAKGIVRYGTSLAVSDSTLSAEIRAAL